MTRKFIGYNEFKSFDPFKKLAFLATIKNGAGDSLIVLKRLDVYSMRAHALTFNEGGN